jgi:hypothetical protein
VSETLDILRRQHQALADYEAARERKQGARTPAELRRIRAIVDAHRKAWLEAGGNEMDFTLAPLLETKRADKPPVDEPAPAERPRRRER